MITRQSEPTLKKLAKQFKSVAVIGPRQSGKTTLVKKVFGNKTYVNLENPDTRRFAIDDPRGFLSQYPNGAILDEVQRTPDLFSYLQQILDNDSTTGKFILTGSNNFLLQESISQSLAGRVAYLYLLPFSMMELPDFEISDIYNVVFKGLYPPLYDQPVSTDQWYQNYIRTYIERDVRLIKNIFNLHMFERFLRLCAGRTGQLLNMNNLAIETGVDNKTIASWLGILENSFIIFRLQPYFKNYNKRIIKMPKLYFYDTGLACSLLGIQNPAQLVLNPYFSALFENLIVSDFIKYQFNLALKPNVYFWRDSLGHEIDMIIEGKRDIYPIELKAGKTIVQDYFTGLIKWLQLSGQNKGAVIYAGDDYQKRSNGIEVFPWNKYHSLIASLFPMI
jgi:predicted AAA+ superfamily ATPase